MRDGLDEAFCWMRPLGGRPLGPSPGEERQGLAGVMWLSGRCATRHGRQSRAVCAWGGGGAVLVFLHLHLLVFECA